MRLLNYWLWLLGWLVFLDHLPRLRNDIVQGFLLCLVCLFTHLLTRRLLRRYLRLDCFLFDLNLRSILFDDRMGRRILNNINRRQSASILPSADWALAESDFLFTRFVSPK